MSMRDSAHDEHDGWPMLHDGWMRDAPTLMRMAHMRRMMDGHGIAWLKVDKRFDGIFGRGWGWGWGWAVFLVCVKKLKKNFAYFRKSNIFPLLT